MAIRLNAAGEFISRTENLGGLGISGFSMSGWFYAETQADNDAWFGLSHSSNGRVVTMKWHNDFPTPHLTINTNTSPGLAPADPPLNTWVFAAMTVGAGPGGAITGYWSVLGSDTWIPWTRGVNDTESSVQGQVVCLGRGRYTDPADDFVGAVAHFRAHDVVLSPAQIQQLKTSIAPLGAWLYWPLASETDNSDASGNNRVATINGAVTSFPSPVLAVAPTLTAQLRIPDRTRAGYAVTGAANTDGFASLVVTDINGLQPSDVAFDSPTAIAPIMLGARFMLRHSE